MFFGEFVFVTGAHFDEVAHVDFLEGGEHSGGVLGFFEAGCDSLTWCFVLGLVWVCNGRY